MVMKDVGDGRSVFLIYILGVCICICIYIYCAILKKEKQYYNKKIGKIDRFLECLQ